MDLYIPMYVLLLKCNLSNYLTNMVLIIFRRAFLLPSRLIAILQLKIEHVRID